MSIPSEQAAVRDVVRYFVEHPESADSLEGIVRWRLLERRFRETSDETAAAVGWLVGHGFLQQIDIPGGRQLYRLPAERLSQAAQLLGENVS
ncbi:MAG TPA: hypothetical protein VNN25_28135 [Thermoanaerobaculia bacterium]|nr:hypothetical protein [Thermoanaerobaculia bacterium]